MLYVSERVCSVRVRGRKGKCKMEMYLGFHVGRGVTRAAVAWPAAHGPVCGAACHVPLRHPPCEDCLRSTTSLTTLECTRAPTPSL